MKALIIALALTSQSCPLPQPGDNVKQWRVSSDGNSYYGTFDRCNNRIIYFPAEQVGRPKVLTPSSNPPTNTGNFGIALDHVGSPPGGRPTYMMPDGPARQAAEDFLSQKSTLLSGQTKGGPEAPRPFDDGKVHLTITGDPQFTGPIEKDLKENPKLVALKEYLLVQVYSPNDWPVTTKRTPSGGKPSIFIEERPQIVGGPGKAAWYADTYPGPDALAEAITEELQRINPNFDLSKVPGPARGKCPLGFSAKHRPWLLGALFVAGVILLLPAARKAA